MNIATKDSGYVKEFTRQMFIDYLAQLDELLYGLSMGAGHLATEKEICKRYEVEQWYSVEREPDTAKKARTRVRRKPIKIIESDIYRLGFDPEDIFNAVWLDTCSPYTSQMHQLVLDVAKQMADKSVFALTVVKHCRGRSLPNYRTLLTRTLNARGFSRQQYFSYSTGRQVEMEVILYTKGIAK